MIIDNRVIEHQKLLRFGIKQISYARSREKGIDVKIAVDLMIGAMDGKYDTAILVSSDTDLVPAMDLVRLRFRKKIEYIGFSMLQSDIYEATRPVERMIGKTDIQRVLVETDIKHFIN